MFNLHLDLDQNTQRDRQSYLNVPDFYKSSWEKMLKCYITQCCSISYGVGIGEKKETKEKKGKETDCG